MAHMRSLSELCSKVTSGGTPSRQHPEYFASVEHGHLWVKSKELLDSSINDTEEKITDLGLKKSSAKYLPKNTVLVAMYGANVGQLGLLRKPATVNQAICGLVVNDEVADFRYVFYALFATRRELVLKAQGAAQQNLNQDAIKNFKIPVPPLDDQHRIASILAAYDDLIENNDRRIAILEELTRRIYEEWFVHFRFPGHEEMRLVESELGPIPKGWEVHKLATHVTVNRASVKKGQEPDSILYIDIASVVPGTIKDKHPYAFADAPGRARRLVTHGDILWSCVRPNRKSHALVLHPEDNLIASTGFAVLTAVSVPYSYLYFSVTTDDFVGYLVNRATGAAYPAVTAKDFEAAPLLKPTDEILTRFHATTEPMLLLCELLKQKNINLRSQRDLLLPKLIAGDIDVSNLPTHEALAA